MENALKALIMAAEIIITCIIVALGFYAADTAKARAGDSTKAVNSYTERITENSYTVYDGAVLSGSELLNLLRYELSRIDSGRGTVAYFDVTVNNRVRLSGSEDIKKLTESGTDHISPYSSFKGETIWKNGNLIALSFRKTSDHE